MSLDGSSHEPRSIIDRSTVEELSEGCTDDIGHLRVALIVSAVERTPKDAAEVSNQIVQTVQKSVGYLLYNFDFPGWIFGRDGSSLKTHERLHREAS